MKLTTKREELLALLKKQTKTLSARALAKKVPSIDQATVYRNLDLFVKEGLVKKFVFEGTESVYEYAMDNHHHAVCDECERVIHFEGLDKNIIKALEIKGFDITGIDLVVRGRCK